MRNRTLVSVAVFSCLAAAGYAAWLKLEEARAWRAAWAEVTDPVQEPAAEAKFSQA
ncbi:DLW-39 family protein [Actinomyces trachealis]|uniref:DLW-39 family protein n=1 Tax=Actinomyces trachealis TaxID=2763540 RepID=UPI0018C56931|nr:DLW-39 family protein [Actinomyces trachealis]